MKLLFTDLIYFIYFWHKWSSILQSKSSLVACIYLWGCYLLVLYCICCFFLLPSCILVPIVEVSPGYNLNSIRTLIKYKIKKDAFCACSLFVGTAAAAGLIRWLTHTNKVQCPDVRMDFKSFFTVKEQTAEPFVFLLFFTTKHGSYTEWGCVSGLWMDRKRQREVTHQEVREEEWKQLAGKMKTRVPWRGPTWT